MMGAAIIAAALSGGAPPPTTARAYVNFRATQAGPAGFPGDAVGDSYSLGEMAPARTFGPGFGFGWSADKNASASNHTNFATKPHQAGRISSTGVDQFFITGLTVGVQYKLLVSQGAITSSVGCGYQLLRADGSTSYAGTNINSTVPGGEFMDAMGTSHASPAAWDANAQGFAFTALDTSVRLYRGSTNGAYWTAAGLEYPL